jgi:hypothetical protein
MTNPTTLATTASLDGQKPAPVETQPRERRADKATPAIAKLGLDLGNYQVKAAVSRNGRIISRVFDSAFSLPQDLGVTRMRPA